MKSSCEILVLVAGAWIYQFDTVKVHKTNVVMHLVLSPRADKHMRSVSNKLSKPNPLPPLSMR